MQAYETPVSPRAWPLDPKVVFLNHGSFGSCPKSVLAVQSELRRRLEWQPIQFLVNELEGLWDNARGVLADFVGAEAADLVFVPNACANALRYVAERSGARVVTASVPFPFKTASQLIDPILAAVTPRTRLALLDHITSPTAVVFPLQRLVEALAERGVDTLVDGAHGPGMVPLRLNRLGAAYYTGNCHKWVCAPKGAAFLHVRRDKQKPIRPLIVSHGANSPRADRPRFLIEFGWTGTGDPTAWLCVPAALRFMGALLPGGWPAVMKRNHELAVAARRVLCEALHAPPPCPEKFLGSMAALPLPDAERVEAPQSPIYTDPLHDRLLREFGLEVPIVPWPAPPKRWVRVSAQLYNSLPQYRRLGQVLKLICPRS
jgi:isopenicillin-N epimerase